MIQDIFPHKLDNHFYPARKASANSFVMAFRHQDILVKGEEFPRVSSFSDDCREKLIYLFAFDEDYYNDELDESAVDRIMSYDISDEDLRARKLLVDCILAEGLSDDRGDPDKPYADDLSSEE